VTIGASCTLVGGTGPWRSRQEPFPPFTIRILTLLVFSTLLIRACAHKNLRGQSERGRVSRDQGIPVKAQEPRPSSAYSVSEGAHRFIYSVTLPANERRREGQDRART
jgi:hypothetical protein